MIPRSWDPKSFYLLSNWETRSTGAWKDKNILELPTENPTFYLDRILCRRSNQSAIDSISEELAIQATTVLNYDLAEYAARLLRGFFGVFLATSTF